MYPNLRKRKAQRALWHLDSTLVHANPAVAQSLLESGSAPPKVMIVHYIMMFDKENFQTIGHNLLIIATCQNLTKT